MFFISFSSVLFNRSVFVKHIIGSIPLYDIIVSNLSNRLLSKFGSFTDVIISAISTFAIFGLIKKFFLGFISNK